MDSGKADWFCPPVPQVRDVSIAQMMEELQQLRTALSRSSDEAPPPQQPPSQSRRRAGHGREGQGREKASLSRKNSAAQSEKSSDGVPACSEPLCADVGTQVERGEGAESEELEEVIGEYTERIGQMQELHAAEIMDMENRHISESDGLKRENQQLQQEVTSLRATITSLHANEVRLLPCIHSLINGSPLQATPRVL